MFNQTISSYHQAQLGRWFLFLVVILSWKVAFADELLIRNVRIISGEKPEVSHPKDVFVRDGIITHIGRNLPLSKTMIDGKNQYLIPGLIDTHVHLQGIPGYISEGNKHPDFFDEAITQIPRSYLYFGFTTLLDLVSHRSFIENWNSQPVAPKTLFCSPIFIPNGYPLLEPNHKHQFESPEASKIIFNPEQAELYPANFSKSEQTPEKMVNRAKDEGARCIKVFYEHGFGRWKNLPVPPITLVQEIIQHAHKQGLKVVLHGNSQKSHEFGLASNVDGIVHGMWHWDNLSKANTSTQRQFVSRYAETDIWVQPTIQVIAGEKEMFDPQFFLNPYLEHAIPKSLLDWYQSDDGQWMKNDLIHNFGIDSVDAEDLYRKVGDQYRTPINKLLTFTKMLSQQGATLLFGSDTPSGPFYTQFPGINARLEMNHWMEAGLSPEVLFTSMTIQNAKALGMQASIGQVNVGMKADLLLLSENPLIDVSAYDTIKKVILNGVPIERQILSAKNQ
jgi:hypothetical protein